MDTLEKGGRDRLRQPGLRPFQQPSGFRRGGRRGSAARERFGKEGRGSGAQGAGHGKGRAVGGRGDDAHPRSPPGGRVQKRYCAGTERRKDPPLRARFQHPFRSDRPAGGRGRGHGRAQRPGAHGAAPVRARFRRAVSHRHLAGRHRARQGRPPSATRCASAAPRRESSRPRSAKKRRPTSSASRPSSAAA